MQGEAQVLLNQARVTVDSLNSSDGPLAENEVSPNTVACLKV
eukprot:SAG31_NODE_2416_length_5732_cov_1.503462_6_plen_42_part_00